MVTVGLLFASLATLVCATPLGRNNLVVFEKLDSAPDGFVHNGPASDSTDLVLDIAMVSSNMDGLEKALYNVSTPSSELYGQHLSKEEVC